MKLSEATKKELDLFVRSSMQSLNEGVKGATSLMKKETPKLLHEIVVFEGIVGNLLTATLALGFVGVMVGISYFVHTYHSDDWAWHILTVILGKVGLGVAAETGYNAIKAKYAPRLFLLNYASNLFSSSEETKK